MVARKSTTIAAPAGSAKRAAAAKPSPAAALAKKVAARPVAKKAAVGAAKAVAASDAGKVKHKLVRDSFTIPKSEYAVLQDMKFRASGLKRPTKKGELLRAGIAALAALNDTAFLAALGKIPSLKTGRPKDPAPTAQPR